MNNQKDELISASELARRLNINPSHISRQKDNLKNAKCVYGKKFYYQKSAKLLGKNPDNPHETIESHTQKPKPKPQEQKQSKREQNPPPKTDEDEKTEVKDILVQIKEAIDNPDTTMNMAKLNGLKQKAAILTEYYKSLNEKIKNRKLEENMFDKDEVVKILSFAISMIRNTLINLPNNYAVALEGMTQKEIKEHTTDDINRMIEDLQKVGEQFE